MPIPLIWGITVAFGFLAWGVFGAQYIWPAISKRERAEALRPILVLHGFRYIGLAVLIPGVVSPQLPATEFARGLAYGDLAAATLALIALAALRTRLAGPLVWIFNIFGTADLLNAFYQGSRLSLAETPGLLGAGYFIPVFGVPLLLVTHVLCVQVAPAERGRHPLACLARRGLSRPRIGFARSKEESDVFCVELDDIKSGTLLTMNLTHRAMGMLRQQWAITHVSAPL